ncbi:FAD-dependent monooxygenase [Aspergillus heterothallicus]
MATSSMKSNSPLPILIIGAGLSGLTAARLLTNAGIPNITFEASPPSRTQGYAISLRDWGYTSLLSALGGIPLSSLTKGVAPDRHISGSGWIDQALNDNHTGVCLIKPPPEANQSIIRANRNALRGWIADCGEEDIDIRFGHRLWEGQRQVIVAEFENGARYRGCMLVAADGVHSAARSLILSKVVPEVVPVVVYHGELRLPREEFDKIVRPHCGESNIHAGVGDGFNTPLTICNITNTEVHMDWSYSRPSTGAGDPLYNPDISAEEAKIIPPALLEEITTRNLAEPWSVFLNEEAMKTHKVFNWVSRCVYVTREDVDGCAERGVVFIGDSWHAMPIFGGEGGNHAIVDGVELAKALKGIQIRADVKGPIKAYYDGSWRRCQDAVKRSRQRFYTLHRPMNEWREIAEKRSQTR